MTRDKIRDLVRECGLDWHRGFMPMFDDDDTNRFEVLVRAATAAALERAAEVCDDYFADLEPTWDKQQDAASRCAKAIRALKEQQ